MEILKNAENERECENHLVLLLGYECFEFIKILLKNRDMISYCIQLKMADDEKREKIVSEMKKRPHLKKILNQLEGEEDDEQKEVDRKSQKNGEKDKNLDLKCDFPKKFCLG